MDSRDLGIWLVGTSMSIPTLQQQLLPWDLSSLPTNLSFQAHCPASFVTLSDDHDT